MDRIGVAKLLFFVFFVKKSAECNNDVILAMSGCDVSFNWTLGNTPSKTIHAIVCHSSNKIAQLIEDECIVSDNATAYCNTSNQDDEWILSLTIFNVTEHKSGNYSIGFIGPGETKIVSPKRLMVIGKPEIMELRKPILHQLFEMTCITTFELHCFTYRWKINGSEITPVRFANANYVSSLRMTDNFSQVTCQVCLNETASNFSSEICKHDGCSEDNSDPYEMKVIYGPYNISLSLKESHFYLKEYEPFTIDCFASCGPKCLFSWKGHDIFEGKKLAITNFESRMAGEYTCYVTNQETNITAKSNPIILQQEKGFVPEISVRPLSYLRVLPIAALGARFGGMVATLSKGEKQVITSLESRMAMQHTCYVTNQQTYITSKTNYNILHYIKEDKGTEEKMGDVYTAMISVGLVGFSVLLAVIGCLLVIQWRKNASSKTDSQILNQPVVNLQIPREMSQGISRIQNRPLPVPNTQETISRRPYRPRCPNHNRKSRSLHNLLDSAQDSFYPLRGGLSFQLLHSPSNIMGRSHRNSTQDYDSVKKRRFSNCEENQLGDISGLENGVKLEVLYAKVRKDKKTNRDEHNVGTKSESLHNLRQESFEEEPQEDLYSTIDEDVLLAYDDARDNSKNENSKEEQMNTRHGESEYDYADLPVI